MKKTFTLSLFLTFTASLFAQTVIKDCGKQQALFNVVVYDSKTNKIIGTTDKNGKVEIDQSVTDITIAHPEYGNIPTVNQAVICMDELLGNIVIDVKMDAKKELMDVLQNTYTQYSIDPYKNQFYYYKGTTYENNMDGEVLEQAESYKKNKTYYNSTHFMSDKMADYMDKGDIVAFSPAGKEVDDYFFFSSKKQFNALLKSLKNLNVKKIDNSFYAYGNGWDNYLLFEMDAEKKLVTKYINTAFENSYFDIGDNIIFKRKSKLIQRLIEVNYKLLGKKVQQQMQLLQVFKLDDLDIKTEQHLKVYTVNEEDFEIKETYNSHQHIRLYVKETFRIDNLAESRKNKK